MRNINWLGLLICAICVAASMFISIQYGLSYSDQWWVGLTYAGIGGAAVAWEVIGAHRIAHLHRERRVVARNICAISLALGTIVTVQYELGYLAALFEGKASVGESRAGNRTSLEAERRHLQAKVDAAGSTRAVAAVDGDLAGVRGHPRWLTSASCTNVTAVDSQALCSRYAALLAERGVAEDIAGAQARIRTINAELQPLAGAKVADARASYIAAMTGSTEMGARILLSGLIILFLFCGRVGAPFCFADPRGGAPLQPFAEAPRREPVLWDVRPGEAVLPPPELLTAVEEADYFDPDEFQALWEIEKEREFLASLNDGRATPSVPVEPATPLDPKMRVAHDTVRAFIKDACVVDARDEDRMERAVNMHEGFKVWQGGYGRSKEAEPVDMLDFTTFGIALKAVLEQLGGRKKQTRHGNAYVGISLRPTVAHRVAAVVAEAKETAEKADQPRRLGSFSQDRRLMDEPMAGTA